MTEPLAISVIFPNVSIKYMINDDITLDILLGPGTYTEYDGVCLLRMGWTHLSQSLVTKRVTTDTDIFVDDWDDNDCHLNPAKATSVVFKASELPDAGEQYYQFCYSSKTHVMLGFSNHFRFTAPNVVHSVERSVEERLLKISKYSDRTADTKLDTMSNYLLELKTTVGKLTDILSAKTTKDMSQLMACRLESEAKRNEKLEKQSIMIKEQQSLIAKQSQDLKAGEELFAIQINELRQQLTTTSKEYQNISEENTRLKESIDEMKTKVKNYFESKELMVRAETEVKALIGSELGVEVLDSESVVSDNTSIATVSEDQELEETIIYEDVMYIEKDREDDPLLV